eukprot:Rhum_TRINITY_DN184_c0_g1::Rhum_TRINITY_DN184_c0_g1_i1::g.570::m.570
MASNGSPLSHVTAALAGVVVGGACVGCLGLYRVGASSSTDRDDDDSRRNLRTHDTPASAATTTATATTPPAPQPPAAAATPAEGAGEDASAEPAAAAAAPAAPPVASADAFSASEPPAVQVFEGGGAFASLTVGRRAGTEGDQDAVDVAELKCWGMADGGGAAPSGLEVAGAVQPDARVAGTLDGFACLTGGGAGERLRLWGRLAQHEEKVQAAYEKLTNGGAVRVARVQATHRTVALEAETGDGVVFGLWGVVGYKGLGLRGLASTEYADAAYITKNDGIFALGEEAYGARPPHRSGMTEKLAATAQAFACVAEDGTVHAWGDKQAGGDDVPSDATDVRRLHATTQAFAAVCGGGRLVAWGNPLKGGRAPSAPAAGEGEPVVVDVAATRSAFAAVTAEGRVLAWGSPSFGGDQGAADRAMAGKKAKEVKATHYAFAVLCEDGSVVSWGDAEYGGAQGAAAALLASDVVELHSGARVFGVIRQPDADPRSRHVLTWGEPLRGGRCPPPHLLADVRALHVGQHAVVAVRNTGHITVWGDKHKGADLGVNATTHQEAAAQPQGQQAQQAQAQAQMLHHHHHHHHH